MVIEGGEPWQGEAGPCPWGSQAVGSLGRAAQGLAANRLQSPKRQPGTPALRQHGRCLTNVGIPVGQHDDDGGAPLRDSVLLPGLVQHADASQQPVVDVGHWHTDRQHRGRGPAGAGMKEVGTAGPAHVPRDAVGLAQY